MNISKLATGITLAGAVCLAVPLTGCVDLEDRSKEPSPSAPAPQAPAPDPVEAVIGLSAQATVYQASPYDDNASGSCVNVELVNKAVPTPINSASMHFALVDSTGAKHTVEYIGDNVAIDPHALSEGQSARGDLCAIGEMDITSVDYSYEGLTRSAEVAR